ncbi:MAG: RNA polymerase sigma factor [Chloroflexota bacterium]
MSSADIHEQIVQTFQQESRIVIAALLSTLCDIELAEDALQDALLDALQQWSKRGIPRNPGAWMMTTAKRKVIDRLRRNQTAQKHLPTLHALHTLERQVEEETQMTHAETMTIPDERLKLIFTCCHPALAHEAQVALTLQTVGGLSTEVIARSFLIPKTTMAQRLVRTKRKIRDAGIPYEVPAIDKLDERLQAVLSVIYFIFNAGYTSPIGDALVNEDLCEEAIRLGRMLNKLLTEAHIGNDKAEAMGLLSLMMLHHARRAARTESQGEMLLMEQQDRSQWNRTAIAEGIALLDSAITMRQRGPFQIQAAIAALHAEADTFEATDWKQIALLYGALMTFIPSSVVAMNRAVAVAFSEGISEGLALLNELNEHGRLDNYYLFHATHADLLKRSQQYEEAKEAYIRALSLCENQTECAFLERQLIEVASRL